MLTQEEEIVLIDELVKRYAISSTFRETLLSPFIGTPFAGQVPAIADIRTFALVAVRQWNDKSGWRADPPALWLLFNGLALTNNSPEMNRLNARIAEIRALNQQVRAAQPALELETVINENVPFVNRNQFRRAVEELAQPTAQKTILFVEGGAMAGKTYSVEYIDHLKGINGGLFNTYVRTFDPDQGMDTSPEDIARDLLQLMGRQPEPDDIPSDKTNLIKYVKDLAMRVLSEATRRNEPQHWFILDNYTGNLREDTRNFLKALSEEVTNGVFASRCRLILLGADRSLLSLVRTSKYREEPVTLCSRPDVEKTLREILRSMPAVQLADVYPFIFDRLPGDVWKMWELNRRLSLLLLAAGRLAALKIDIAPNTFDERAVLVGFLARLPELPPVEPAEPAADGPPLTTREKDAGIRRRRNQEADSIRRDLIAELDRFRMDILDAQAL